MNPCRMQNGRVIVQAGGSPLFPCSDFNFSYHIFTIIPLILLRFLYIIYFVITKYTIKSPSIFASNNFFVKIFLKAISPFFKSQKSAFRTILWYIMNIRPLSFIIKKALSHNSWFLPWDTIWSDLNVYFGKMVILATKERRTEKGQIWMIFFHKIIIRLIRK